jgi:hypothetical protein
VGLFFSNDVFSGADPTWRRRRVSLLDEATQRVPKSRQKRVLY